MAIEWFHSLCSFNFGPGDPVDKILNMVRDKRQGACIAQPARYAY